MGMTGQRKKCKDTEKRKGKKRQKAILFLLDCGLQTWYNLNRRKDVIPMAVSREYKDRLFKFIFGNPDNKQWTLNLYNAINDSHYTDLFQTQP